VSRRCIWAHAIDGLCNIGGCFLLEVCCEQAMHMGLTVDMVSDHVKKQLVAKYISDCGIVKDCAAHAAPRMLLTRLTIVIRTIGSALWFVEMGEKEEKGQKGVE